MSGMIVLGEYATYSTFGRSHQLPLTGAAGCLERPTRDGRARDPGHHGLFPTGSLLSSRWRPLGWALAVAGVTAIAVTAFGGPNFNSNLDTIRNPIAIDHPARMLLALAFLGDTITFLAIAGVGVQLVVRLLKSQGD